MKGAKGRILLVEENVDFAENVAEVLGEFGFSTDHVVDPRAALGIAAEYDCIVSEQTLPHLSGIEMIDELRRHGCGVPVVILSSQADATLEEEALSAGALLVLSKYGFEQWACTLLNALERLRRPASGFMRKVTVAAGDGRPKASGMR